MSIDTAVAQLKAAAAAVAKISDVNAPSQTVIVLIDAALAVDDALEALRARLGDESIFSSVTQKALDVMFKTLDQRIPQLKLVRATLTSVAVIPDARAIKDALSTTFAKEAEILQRLPAQSLTEVARGLVQNVVTAAGNLPKDIINKLLDPFLTILKVAAIVGGVLLGGVLLWNVWPRKKDSDADRRPTRRLRSAR